MHAGLHTLHTGFSEGDMAERTIKCTPDNAAQFQQVVRHWPELHDLVKQLQAQDLFPGLRAMQITLMGDESHCARGLGALLPEDAQEGQK